MDSEPFQVSWAHTDALLVRTREPRRDVWRRRDNFTTYANRYTAAMGWGAMNAPEFGGHAPLHSGADEKAPATHLKSA